MNAQGKPKLASILARLAHYRQLISHKIIDNIRSNQCLLCLQPAQTRCLCVGCLQDLPWQGRACTGCALALPDEGTEERCVDCQQNPPRWQSAHAVFQYQFPIDRLIAAFKYHHQLALTDFFAELMSAQLTPPHGETLLVPVPLHPDRLRLRGYDQTLLLTRAISQYTGLPYRAQMLCRTRDTIMQKQLHREARQENLAGAFACQTSDLGRFHVVVIDDVMTTGATLNVISEVLLQQGAKSVQALVIARTLPS